jgi:thiol-disulfide isomerase/thioredoxin
MKAIPILQSLHEKYHAKGLQVVGINPYDTKEDDLPTFLGKRGVTYPVLLGGKEVAANYHVSGYPTLYLIDQEGQIIFLSYRLWRRNARKDRTSDPEASLTRKISEQLWCGYY